MSRPAALDADALLVDLGGVILEVDFGRAFAAWAAAARVPVATVSARFRFDAAYAAHERGEIGAAQYFASLRRSLGIDLSDAQFLLGWNAIIGSEIPGVRPLLAAAAMDLPLYLFSNTSIVHRDHWMPRCAAVLRPFRQCFLSCEIGLRKPEREAFAHVAERIGAPPGRIVFLDDTEQNVAGARTAGLRAFRVRSAAEVAEVLQLSA